MTRPEALATFGLVTLFAVLQLLFIGLTNDTQMLLMQSSHLLSGGGLYTHWVAVNSPLIYLIYTVPVFITVTFPISSAVALNGMTLLLCVLSLVFLRQRLRNKELPKPEQRLWLAVAAVALIVVPSLTGTFADREHYLFIFALPWMMLMLLRLQNHSGAAVLATVGFCLKPYNLIFLAALTVFGGIRQERWTRKVFSRPTMFAIAFAALYLASTILVFPAYLFQMLPLASTTYGEIAHPLGSRFIKGGACLMVALVLARWLKPYPARQMAFTALALAAAVVFVMNAGWTYTLYLMSVPILLLCAAVWLARLTSFSRVAAMVVMTVILLGSGYRLVKDIRSSAKTGLTADSHPISSQLRTTLQDLAGNQFILFSHDVWPSNIEALRGSPRAVFPIEDGPWPYAWVLKHSQDPRAKAIWQTYFVRPVVTELKADPAPVLIVDESPGQLWNPFSRLQQDADVQDALASYKEQILGTCKASRDTLCRFAVWRRR